MILLAALCSAAATDHECPAVSAAEIFHTSYLQWDASGFERVIGLCETALEAAPAKTALWYWKGASEFHLALHRLGQTNMPRRAALPHLKDARDSFEQLLEIDPDHAEAHALLANVIGLFIARQPLTAVWRGSGVSRHKDRALELAPDNPRVQYLLASSYYHAPHLLNGKDKGLDLFLHAEELFEREAEQPAEPGAPRWGHNSCLAFIGRIYEDMGEWEKALDCFEQALDINPDGQMAGEGLQRVKEKINRGDQHGTR